MNRPLSASQLETFGCLRRGVLTYVYGLKEPMKPSFELGTRVHAIGEAWLKNGTEPDFDEVLTIEGKTYLPGQIFDPARDVLPPPGHAMTELEGKCSTPHSEWVTRKDFIFTPGSKRVVGNGHVRLGDFKTTKAKKWVKSAAQLSEDTAATIYAYDLYEEGAELVDGLWIYLRTEGKPHAWQVSFDLPRSAVYDRMGLFDERARVIHALKSEKPRVEDVPYNTKRCDDFGGCRFRNKQCVINVCDMFAKKGEVDVGSILERLKKKTVDFNGAKTDSNGFTITEQHKFDTKTGEPIDKAEEPTGTPVGQPEQGFINTPAQEPYVSTISEPVSFEPKTEADDGLDDLDREALKGMAVAHGLCAPNDKRRADAFRALLRGNGIRNEAPAQSPGPEPETVATKTRSEEIAERILASCKTPPPAINVPPIEVLYIACLPNTPVTEAQDIVSAVLPKVLEAAGEAHHKLVQYGKGSGLLAAAVEEHVRAETYRAVFADRFTDAEVLASLVRLSAMVVRGL